MHDKEGKNVFEWIVPERFDLINAKPQFLDWQRFEPNNHTVSVGKETLGGERCVHLIPWQETPLLEEEGGWNDDSCTVKRPFICQTSANSIRYKLSVSQNMQLNGGHIVGGILSTGAGSSVINSFKLSRSSYLQLNSGSSDATLSHLMLMDGSRVDVSGNLVLANNAWVGESYDMSENGAQSYVMLISSSSLSFSGSNSKALFNSRVVSEGKITVSQNSTLSILQVTFMFYKTYIRNTQYYL